MRCTTRGYVGHMEIPMGGWGRTKCICDRSDVSCRVLALSRLTHDATEDCYSPAPS